MTEIDEHVVRLSIPADARLFRPVRLAVGGVATFAGFDVEAMEDLRIASDELCSALVESGDGGPIDLELAARLGSALRITGTTTAGPGALDDERYGLSQQILSVVSDDYGHDVADGTVTFWIERQVAAWDHDDRP